MVNKDSLSSSSAALYHIKSTHQSNSVFPTNQHNYNNQNKSNSIISKAIRTYSISAHNNPSPLHKGAHYINQQPTKTEMSTPTTETILPLLRPVVALVGWTFGVESWMYMTRIPALRRLKVALTPESTNADMNKALPAIVRWKGEIGVVLFLA